MFTEQQRRMHRRKGPHGGLAPVPHNIWPYVCNPPTWTMNSHKKRANLLLTHQPALKAAVHCTTLCQMPLCTTKQLLLLVVLSLLFICMFRFKLELALLQKKLSLFIRKKWDRFLAIILPFQKKNVRISFALKIAITSDNLMNWLVRLESIR